MSKKSIIFCALDTADLDTATLWARTIGPVTGGLKLGMEFINAFGPQGIDTIQDACPDAQLFIDLKFHDIPNTVAGAVRAVTSRFAPAYLNVHAAGGTEMMSAAKAACGKSTKLLGVTVLTSLIDADMQQIGFAQSAAQQVEKLALLTQKAGLDGVVCSAHEIELLREICGKDFILMVPGIRPVGSDGGDQKRVMTPPEAMQKGATHLVIGRPITHSDDPRAAANAIIRSLAT
jgi:orotidine-5'-phosphate decarboxylase